MVDSFMLQTVLGSFRSSCWERGVACLIMLLCICVVTQMLGAPFTLLGALSSDILTESEPVSEDMTALSPSPEPDKPRLFYMLTDFHSVHHPPVLLTSVFHPPPL